jgi:hypothetical protein
LSLARVSFTRVLAAHPIYYRHLMTFSYYQAASFSSSSFWLLYAGSSYCQLIAFLHDLAIYTYAWDANQKQTAKTFAFVTFSNKLSSFHMHIFYEVFNIIYQHITQII